MMRRARMLIALVCLIGGGCSPQVAIQQPASPQPIVSPQQNNDPAISAALTCGELRGMLASDRQGAGTAILWLDGYYTGQVELSELSAGWAHTVAQGVGGNCAISVNANRTVLDIIAALHRDYGDGTTNQQPGDTQEPRGGDSFAKRINAGTPMAGSESALRRQIEAFARGQPDYADMTEKLASVTRPQFPKIQRAFAALGPLQSISFMGIGLQGWDVYNAKFANGITVWRITLGPAEKVSGLLYQSGP